MKHQLTLADGTEMHYHVYHQSAAPTVIMIHGITGNHKGFQYITPQLPNIRCIVPDLPGFGDSDLPPKTSWTVDGIATLANEFVELLHLDTPPIIIGHSMGGLVVSSMVSQRPDLYDQRVILISPVPTPVRRLDARAIGSKLGSAHYNVSSRTGKVGERLVKSQLISRALTRLMVQTPDKDRRRDIYKHHLDNLDYFSDSKFYHQLHNDINRLGSIDYAAALREKTVLLIAGNNDNVTPIKEMNTFASAITPAQYIVIPGVGHLIHYEKSPEASEAIVEFIGV